MEGYILNVFYHQEVMGWNTGFSKIKEKSDAHWDKMNFSAKMHVLCLLPLSAHADLWT